MKKSALLILVAAVLCLGTSCGEKAQEEESFPEITETAATTEEVAEPTAEGKNSVDVSSGKIDFVLDEEE